MSKDSIRKNLTDKLLKYASKDENVAIRKQAQAGRPQVVYLNTLEWLDSIILQMMKRLDANAEPQIKKRKFKRYNNPKDIKKAQAIGKRFQDDYIRQAGVRNWFELQASRRLRLTSPQTWEMLNKGTAVVVSSFFASGELKSAIIDEVLRKSLRGSIDLLKSKVDRGHGAGAGAAISAISIARGAQAIQDILGAQQQEEFASWLDTNVNNLIQSGEITQTDATLIKELVLNYEQVLQPDGTLKAEYIPFITFQDKYANRTIDGPREKRYKALFFKFFQEFPVENFTTIKGSDSLEEQIGKRLFKNFKPVSKKKNVTLKVEAKYQGKSKGGRGKTTSSARVKRGVIRKNAIAAAPALTGQKRGPASTPLRMIASFNTRLTEKIKANMRAPALVNRTGRFAESVTVKTMERTPQGYSSFGYTYQMDPYQVFERGRGQEPWTAGGDRDPRKLIDKTMREIAAEEAMGRFFTRRL